MPRPTPSPEERTVQTSIAISIGMLNSLEKLQRALKIESRSALARLAFGNLLQKHAKAMDKAEAEQ